MNDSLTIPEQIALEGDSWSGEMAYAKRHSLLKHWCGYVAVGSKHPLFGKSYGDRVPPPDGFENRELNDKTPIIALFCESGKDDGLISLDLAIEVHGGITFGGESYWNEEKDDNWWLGFDCGHAGDWSCLTGLNNDPYRNLSYVKDEIRNMAVQLARWKT